MARFIAIDPKDCTGCKTCEMVCSLYHSGQSNTWKSAIRVARREKDGLVFCLPLVCQQCADPKCLEVCPTRALTRRTNEAPLVFDRAECTDCGACVVACPAACVPTGPQGEVVMYCDLCGGEPQCVPNCHAACLAVTERKGAKETQTVAFLAEIVREHDLWGYIPGKRLV